ncbi:MAG: cell division topological specificity factor MinE [Proteobacteria bacterium]|nr:cell division topological specificity factor MinE [Pseudomonadota bacterium]
MSIFNYLRKRNNTASVAKERLQIIISHERSQRLNTPDYLPKLQEEILAVIAKYVRINPEQVSVNLERLGDNAVLELNVTMPDEALEKA